MMTMKKKMMEPMMALKESTSQMMSKIKMPNQPEMEKFDRDQKERIRTNVRNATSDLCTKKCMKRIIVYTKDYLDFRKCPMVNFHGKFAQKTNIFNHFSCPHCPKTFNEKANYDYHMQDHTNYRPAKCHLCEKRFKNKQDLASHIRCHKVTISLRTSVQIDKHEEKSD